MTSPYSPIQSKLTTWESQFPTVGRVDQKPKSKKAGAGTPDAHRTSITALPRIPCTTPQSVPEHQLIPSSVIRNYHVRPIPRQQFIDDLVPGVFRDILDFIGDIRSIANLASVRK